MATTIFEQGPVCDGYDVRCRLGDGRLRTFHFATQPADAQEACNALEAGIVAAEAAEADADDWQIVES
jgi:hypothetical protein